MKRKKAKDSIEFHGKTVPLAAIGEMDYGDQNEILSKRGNAIQYIEEPTEEQKLIAVKQNGWALKYTSEELKNDKEVVLEAVKRNGLTLQYASKELQNNKEIVFYFVPTLHFVNPDI